MKKRWITRGVPLALALMWMLALAACAPAQPVEGGPGETPAETSTVSPVESEEPGAVQVSQTFRIVDGAEDGSLLLADLEGGSGIYRLSVTDDIPITLDGGSASAADLTDGMELTVTYDGTILETWPGTLSQVYALSAATPVGGGYTDLCGFYLKVLDDLWQVDSGLNSGITQAAVDLSQAPGNLTEGEKDALIWRFGQSHGVDAFAATWDELAEGGYLTEAVQGGNGTSLYQWEDGVHFSIDVDEEAVWNLPDLAPGEEPPVLLAFDARKWRSGLGAYFFADCVARQGADGAWTYTVGSELIA